ncbi:unnamed protein product [Rhizophagus irregularis]|uniref:Uncharacterized protein n=1 Tax=Rhizophagus irregularis TaxID=588596 RepID=A0A2I1GC84_9GLOM|nr:hypothetical protein RhiirA4_458469 [Rhizophagus irregularis]CAB4441577.1 unnamed protein product [Rhizophagus irregularis]
MPLNEKEVVNLINKWRLNGSEDSTPESSINHLEKEKQSANLRKDNVAQEEVVDVIKTYREEVKVTKYNRLKDSATSVEILEKVYEIENIFTESSNEMEWEQINLVVMRELKEELNMTKIENFRDWMNSTENKMILRKRIINAAENNEVFAKYTMLNKDFTKRLKDENRYQDTKVVGDKRPILESPIAPDREPWLIKDDVSAEEEEEVEEQEVKIKKEEIEIKKDDNKSPPVRKKKKNKRKGRNK